MLDVLQHHHSNENKGSRKTKVYLLPICLGHPFAVQVALRLLPSKQEDGTVGGNGGDIELCGLTMVAPFASTLCPDSWRIARLGHAVGSWMLRASTGLAASLKSTLMPLFLKPSTLESLFSDSEKEKGDWKDPDDYQEMCRVAMEMEEAGWTRLAMPIDARLGTSPVWQSRVCDVFAQQSGCGLVVENGDNQNTQEPSSSPIIPIKIHACLADKVAPFDAIEWLVRRCYGGSVVQIEEWAQCHEIMTFLGGPLRNPTLLFNVAQDWGLKETSSETSVANSTTASSNSTTTTGTTKLSPPTTTNSQNAAEPDRDM